MISRLRGPVWEAEGGSIVVGACGVGYEVQVPGPLALTTAPGSEVDLHVRLIVREDDWCLYGFERAVDRRAFDLLRETKGCGPKTSLALVGQLGADGVARAVASHDFATLSKAPGVGPRLAEKICAELKDKVMELSAASVYAAAPGGRQEDEVVPALVALGYRRSEAEAAALQAEGGSVEDRILAALRTLRR
jgi:Holliday junction DNA helicase RuvA